MTAAWKVATRFSKRVASLRHYVSPLMQRSTTARLPGAVPWEIVGHRTLAVALVQHVQQRVHHFPQ